MHDTLPVLTYPNPFLKKKAQEVLLFDVSLKHLVSQMGDTMEVQGGIGLAAPQVGSSLALFVIDKEIADTDEHLIVVNPRIVSTSPSSHLQNEGCLSFPGIFVDVLRPDWVVLAFQNAEGEPRQVTATGLFGQALLHEYDHLCGQLLTDRVSIAKKEKIRNQMRTKNRPSRQNQGLV